MRLLIIICLLLATAACNKPSKPAEDENTNEPTQEAKADAEPGPAFRAVLAEFTKAQWPGTAIKGSTKPRHRLDFWLVALDLSGSNEHQIKYIFASEFYKADNSRYWNFAEVSRPRYYKELRERIDQTIIPKSDESENDPFAPYQ
jgi:hypothetical protein